MKAATSINAKCLRLTPAVFLLMFLQTINAAAQPAAYRLNTEDTFEYDTAANGLGQLHRETRTQDATQTYRRSQAYDGLGRPISIETAIDGVTYPQSLSYDPLSRPAVMRDATNQETRNQYTRRGFLLRLEDATTNAPLYTVIEHDERGNPTKERLGQSVITQRSYDEASGVISTIRSGTGTFPITDAGSTLQNLAYSYDKLDNLMSREDRRPTAVGGGQREDFTYDLSNRLIQAALVKRNGVTLPVPIITTALRYDQLGNICEKNGVPYQYGRGSNCPAGQTTANGPHQLAKAFGRDYLYDSSGNLISEQSQTSATELRAMSYDATGGLVRVATANADTTTFSYAPNGLRYKRTDQATGNASRTTRYIDGVEIQTDPGGSATLRYLGLNVLIRQSGSNTPQLYFTLRDHLGSVDVVANSGGVEVERISYDAHGTRRNPGNWTDPAPVPTPQVTRRGFTDHEHLNAHNLIHMNGRVYDPATGRFLQPDPIIQDPFNTQSWNRYSCVLNNPLSFTDPSGNFLRGLKRLLRRVAADRLGGIAANLIPGGGVFSTLIRAFVHSAVSSYVLQGDLKTALSAGLTAMGAKGLAVLNTKLGTDTVATSFHRRVLSSAATEGANALISGTDFWRSVGSGAFLSATRADWLTKTSPALGGAYDFGISVLNAKLLAGDYGFVAREALSAYGAKTAYTAWSKTVGFDPNPKPGTQAQQRHLWDPPPAETNTVGTQGDPIPTGLAYFYSLREGGLVSELLNLVPGLNAVSKLHDNFQVNVNENLRNNQLYNISGMIVAVGWTYPAIAGLKYKDQSNRQIFNEASRMGVKR